MIFSLQSRAEEQQREQQTPGLYLRTPAPETYAIQPSVLGLPGVIGYARRRDIPSSDEAPGGMWPVTVSSVEEAQQLLEFPRWGLLLPSLALFFGNGGRRCRVVGLPETEAHTLTALVPSTLDRRAGLAAFDRAGGIELLLAPDLFVVPPGCRVPGLEEVVGLQHCLIDFAAGLLPCSERAGGLTLLDVPPGLTAAQLSTYVSLLRLHPSASYGALYGPWVQVTTARAGLGVSTLRDGQRLQLLPPSAAVAGVMATLSTLPDERSSLPVTLDIGPHQSPANRRLEGLFGLERAFDPQERERLLRAHINCLIPRTGDGFRLWGDRTLSQEEALRQVTVRRILSFIQRSIYLSSQWAVFEPNTWTLWLQLTAQVEIFLEGLYNAGVIVGNSPEDAFFVKCDSETNPPEAVAAGQILLQVSVRPARATEVMVVEIIHRQGSDMHPAPVQATQAGG